MREMVEVKRCDRCQKMKEEIHSFGFPLERYVDASGNTSTRTVDFDLCCSCQCYIIRKMLEGTSDIKTFAESLGIVARVVD